MNKKNDLNKIRKQIDDIDIKILSLLNKRAGLARKTTVLKKDKVFDPKREKEILLNLMSINTGPITRKSIEKIYSEILNTCREVQSPTKVAYLGPEGSNTYEAVLRRFGERTAKTGCITISDVFRSVQNEHQEYGVVPIAVAMAGTSAPNNANVPAADVPTTKPTPVTRFVIDDNAVIGNE